jgi:hypothetical protein
MVSAVIMILKSIKKLSLIWSHSDSQPTEITLALINVLLTHLAIGSELGGLYFERIIIISSGIFQLYCVSQEDIKCRVRASMITFGVYTSTFIVYLLQIGMPTATHYGWLVLSIASFGSMRRLILEKLYRNG